MKGYKFATETENNIDPRKVDPSIYGHHESWVAYRIRHWRFATEEGRDLFERAVKEGAFK